MADKKSKIQAVESGTDGPESGPSLGKVITEARERKGLTREQVATEAHIPPHYVKMIESDSYDMISDRLYLVPFLRRYASFLGLDAEEIASRFVSNVQHAEANVVRISQEITVVAKKPGAAGRIAFAVLIGAVLILLADFAWRKFGEREAPVPAPVTSPAAERTEPEPKAQASIEAMPPASIVTNPEAAPPALNSPAPPRPIPRTATDN